MTKASILAMCVAFLPSVWGVSWTASNIKATRRLAIETGMTGDASDPTCIVGGFDTANPSKVYVGGPCSELDTTGDDPEPQAGFRWLEMQTVYLQITSGGEEVEMNILDSPTMNASEDDNQMQVGVKRTFSIDEANAPNAAMFASTTSYLAKASFSFNTNSFIIYDDLDSVDVCVKECCASPPEDGCDCADTCPTTKIDVEPGEYKYSILVGAYDNAAESDYTAGAAGNGWERLVADYGNETEDGGKALSGFLEVYQTIDFTNMNADTMTVVGGGAETTYANMATCNLIACDTLYAVESISLAADGWSSGYVFPLTYNLGLYEADENFVITPTPKMTKAVEVHMVKPDADMLAAVMDNSDYTSSSKIVLLRYKFDIEGITAAATSGAYMVYDPTITTTAPSESSESTGSGNDSAANSTNATNPAVVAYASRATIGFVVGVAIALAASH